MTYVYIISIRLGALPECIPVPHDSGHRSQCMGVDTVSHRAMLPVCLLRRQAMLELTKSLVRTRR
eukprot:3406667-Rhodomonas_salina.2